MKKTLNNKGIVNETDGLPHWRKQLHTVIFESETPAGKLFDVLLLIFILLSVATVVLDSVASVKLKYGPFLFYLEWFLTIAFTIEYILRLLSVTKPVRYATSFLGIIDLISIVPTYLSLILAGMHALIVIRVVRLLRVFRIFKLVNFIGEAGILVSALRASRIKIMLFIFTVICIVVINGTIMFIVEGPENGFTSIPVSMYWAVVTLTTVGYGDIAPQTPLGQGIASFIMILGYGIIAVPTGIVTSEMVRKNKKIVRNEACPNCGSEGHDMDAVFCRICGSKL